MNRRLTISPLSRPRPVVHNFKREASAKEGATNGGLYMERRQVREANPFGASAEGKVSTLQGAGLHD